MAEGAYPPDGDMRLCARRSVWRSAAGQTVSNPGRIASVVALTEDGERILRRWPPRPKQARWIRALVERLGGWFDG